MTEKILPQPCNGPLYDDWSLTDFMNKIYEEVNETESALRIVKDHNTSENREHVFLEATDVITATTSLLERLGCNEQMRQEYQRRVNESNAVRDGGMRIRKADAVKQEIESIGRPRTKWERKTMHRFMNKK